MRASLVSLVVSLATLSLVSALPQDKLKTNAASLQQDHRTAEALLRDADAILSQPPTDDHFGLSRLPTLHGRQYFDGRKSSEKACAEAWQLLEPRNTMAILSLGRFDRETGQHGRRSVMSGHYQLNLADFVKGNEYFEAESHMNRHVVPEVARDLLKSGKRTLRREFDYAGNRAFVDARTVLAKRECLSCHPEAKAGKPLGVIALVRIPK